MRLDRFLIEVRMVYNAATEQWEVVDDTEEQEAAAGDDDEPPAPAARDARIHNHGAERRRHYTAKFKLGVVDSLNKAIKVAMEEKESTEGLAERMAQEVNVSPSLLSKWRKERCVEHALACRRQIH